MRDELGLIGFVVAFISVLTFFFGILRLIFVEEKKISLKIILYSAIAFVIGFGTCAANFSLSGMH